MPETPVDTKRNRQDTGIAVALVYATFPSEEVARPIVRGLVEQRLIACANIIPAMTAIYEWEGAVHEDREVVVIAKTQRAVADAVVAEIKRQHPYENPALLVISVDTGSQEFMAWITKQTRTAS